ncbi:MAG: creatininase family protein [Euryarchaeota archaeon]|nr:creatininase family protein [Euryarchaeota archaeon]
MTAKRLDELSTAEFGKMVGKDPVVFLPIGAVEEHGAHLPLGTDSLQPEYIVQKVADRLPGPALIAPPLRYGNCVTTRNFPGTISLSFDTLRALVQNILEELCRNGIRRIVIVSGHAGGAHMAALRTAGENVVDKAPDLRLMVLSDYDLAYELRGAEFDPRDGHAGAIETSRVMAIRPGLVKKKGQNSFDRPPKYMLTPHPERYFPTGVMGEAGKASQAKGRRINEYIVKGLTELIKANLS